MIPDDGLGSASKEDGEEQEMEERHWEDLWHLELDNMEDSPILEMGVKPLKTQCHQQAPETGSNISRKNICSPAHAGGVDRSFSSHESNGEKDV